MLKILSILAIFLASHLYLFYEGEDYNAIWFVLNSLALALLSTSKSSYDWVNDICKGYFIGYLIETIRTRYLGYEENHYGEILLIVFLATGYVWRKYKDKTITVAMITGLSTALKWVVTKILTLLFS